MSTTWLDTDFANGLTPGGLGFDLVQTDAQLGTPVTTPSAAIDTTHPRSGTTKCARILGTAVYLHKSISAAVTVTRFYMRFDTTPTLTGPIFFQLLDSNTSCKFQLGLSTSRWITPFINSTNGTHSTTTLTQGTWYRFDVKCDTTTSTYTLDCKISNLAGTLLETMTQQTLSGQPAFGTVSSKPSAVAQLNYRLGSVLASHDNNDFSFGGVKITDSAGDYPIGAGTGDDTWTPVTRTYSPVSWIDYPQLIHGGVLTGIASSLGGKGGMPNLIRQMEGTAKMNRTVAITHTYYGDTNAPQNRYAETTLMDGSLLGHDVDPIIGILGYGNATNWPSGGLAKFTDGTMDSVIQGWCTWLNTLPPKPVLVRLWREMNLTGSSYTTNGSAHGGINETSANYIAAYRYVVAYMKARCPWVRYLWNPASQSGMTTASYAAWYPGDAYVDWVGTDFYDAGSSFTPSQMQTFYDGFNPLTGSVAKKPMLVAETQVNNGASSRVTDYDYYVTYFTTTYPGISAVVWWDFFTYEVNDNPSGSLAKFQSTVAAAPFTGAFVAPNTTNERVISQGQTLSAQSTNTGIVLAGKVTDGTTLDGV